MIRYPVLFIIALILFLSGCFTGPPTQKGLPGQVPPGHVRIKGTITSILKDSAGDSCFNCIAFVKVDSVEGFGPKAKAIFSGDTLKIKFMYSLSPYTDTTSSDRENSLPGLYINDIFRGDIECTGEEGGKCIYRIYWYVKQTMVSLTRG